MLCGGVAKKGQNRSLVLGHAWYRVRLPWVHSLCLNVFYSNQALHQLIVMMKSTIIHFKQYLIAA
jgi:hypothetical protein